jgi:hypothetical protein
MIYPFTLKSLIIKEVLKLDKDVYGKAEVYMELNFLMKKLKKLIIFLFY